MAPKYIDTHAHLFYDDYKNDLEVVLSDAKKLGVEYFIVPGTDLKTSIEAIKLSERYERVYACVGIHPHEAIKAAKKDLEEIEKLSRHEKVVAIGEIGLDYHYSYSPRKCQIEYLTGQIEIAVRQDLPTVIHTRESMDDTFKIILDIINNNPEWKMKNGKYQRGVFHCFTGTEEDANILADIGYYVSYTGIITFKKSMSVNIVKNTGINNILLETDSPYMTPVPLRGKRNEPANIVFIGRKISEELNITEEEVASITSKNAINLFSLPNISF